MNLLGNHFSVTEVKLKTNFFASFSGYIQPNLANKAHVDDKTGAPSRAKDEQREETDLVAGRTIEVRPRRIEIKIRDIVHAQHARGQFFPFFSLSILNSILERRL